MQENLLACNNSQSFGEQNVGNHKLLEEIIIVNMQYKYAKQNSLLQEQQVGHRVSVSRDEQLAMQHLRQPLWKQGTLKNNQKP